MGSIDGKEMTSVKSDVGSLHISNFIKFHKWFSNRFLDGFKAFCTIAKPQFVVKKHMIPGMVQSPAGHFPSLLDFTVSLRVSVAWPEEPRELKAA